MAPELDLSMASWGAASPLSRLFSSTPVAEFMAGLHITFVLATRVHVSPHDEWKCRINSRSVPLTSGVKQVLGNVACSGVLSFKNQEREGSCEKQQVHCRKLMVFKPE